MWDGKPAKCAWGHYDCDVRSHHECCWACKDDRCPAYTSAPVWKGAPQQRTLYVRIGSGHTFLLDPSGRPYNAQQVHPCPSSGVYYSVGIPENQHCWDSVTGQFKREEYRQFTAPCVGWIGEIPMPAASC